MKILASSADIKVLVTFARDKDKEAFLALRKVVVLQGWLAVSICFMIHQRVG